MVGGLYISKDLDIEIELDDIGWDTLAAFINDKLEYDKRRGRKIPKIEIPLLSEIVEAGGYTVIPPLNLNQQMALEEFLEKL